ncbi:MAG: cation:proton antiporter subunit C [Planctomycetota bacterium]|nr:cation:proton antiporter subunit C [Planctomycetota bacterium]
MTCASLLDWLPSHWHYLVYIVLMMIGLYAVLAKGNLVKKVIGLNILQTAVFLFYLSIGHIDGATVPVKWHDDAVYENPIPHVLMLTAIVVGVSVTAVALALIVRIKETYGTVEEIEVLDIDERETAEQEGDAPA